MNDLSQPLLLRVPTEDDSDRMITLAQQLGYDITRDHVIDYLKRSQGDREQLLLIAEYKGHVCGWISAKIHRLLIVPPFVEIEGLVVDSQYQRCGIGSTLLTTAEWWTRSHELTLVRLRSNITRTEAHSFYVRHGYELSKTSHQFRKVIPDEP
jgi:GNAT superfamily N-acetyltransferase